MLPRAQRLTTSQFDRAFAQAQTVRHPLIVLRAHFRGDGEEIMRAAFVVPKKQGKAILRNRTRRRVRECYRLRVIEDKGKLTGCDLIFLTTPQTHGATQVELNRALEDVLRRAGKRMAGENSNRNSTARKRDEKSEVNVCATPIESKQQDDFTKPILPLTYFALGLIRFYQRFISPGLPPSCRFEPSCSRYTYATIERFGLWRGGFLGFIRLCKCHPWHEGGVDPVPQHLPNLRSENQNRKKSWPFFGLSKPR